MKTLKNTYRWLFVGVFSLIVSHIALAQDVISENDASASSAEKDSVEVSLLTCSPGTELYSLYGHTALRYHDLRTGVDMTFNYGVFNFRQEFFILKFIFGLTDYELGICPMQYFVKEYERRGSQVTEQVINFTPEEKRSIYRALTDNYKPQNRVYRYNCLYDNCTTRARDMIEKNLVGEVTYNKSASPRSYRDMLRQYTEKYPWATFGNDLILGFGADREVDGLQQQFLPEYMMIDAERATILRDGQYRQLVKESRCAVEGGVQIIEQPFPITPFECSLLLLVIAIAVMVVELQRKTVFRLWDTLLMTLSGLAGILLFAMLFSQHPTTSTNLQVLLLNPLPLFFLPRLWRKKHDDTFWRIAVVMYSLFFLGGIIQDYAEGMFCVGAALASRCIVHFKLR